MGIQSTLDITRETAIWRIREVHRLVSEQKFQDLKDSSFESDDTNMWAFLKEYSELDISHIENWTNEMLEEVIDRPFFRSSMFYNYLVYDDEDEIKRANEFSHHYK